MVKKKYDIEQQQLIAKAKARVNSKPNLYDSGIATRRSTRDIKKHSPFTEIIHYVGDLDLAFL